MKKGLWVSAAAVLLAGCSAMGFSPGAVPVRAVSLIVEPAASAPAAHGAEALQKAFRAQGWAVAAVPSLSAAKAPWVVVAGTPKSPAVAGLLGESGEPAPSKPEALAVKRIARAGQRVLLLCGADDRGLMYAELDAAERIGWAKGSDDPFAEIHEIREEPKIAERALTAYTFNRNYWESRFYDENYWKRYFDTLAADRFNAFVLIFGYENGGFMAPAYPYFFDLPEYPGVRFNGITPDQQRKNLAALNRLIALAHERGIAVQFGIWDHIYRGGVQAGGIEWAGRYPAGAIPNTVSGIDQDNLVPYNQAALEHFLKAVPDLDRVSFRMHPESGLRPSEMEKFWTDIFALIKRVKPSMGVELRSKELPDSIIKIGLATGLNLRVETKFWMEQMGLPFHPTHINTQDQNNRRHGYADLLKFPQTYKVMWRLWNGGTARVLLWGDPEYVRRYTEAATLYGSDIWEVDEPLENKMEAQPPDMKPFDLMPAQYRYYDYEFERYWHFFKVWGRLGYDPQTPADALDRDFADRFGAAAGADLESGLHRASWILPYIVSAVYPYSGFPATVGWAEKQPLGATLAQYARNQGTDIAQFENFQDAAARIAKGGSTAMRTPEASAAWLDSAADDVLASVEKAQGEIGEKRSKEFDSTATDLRILAGLARFHARRARAAVHWNLYGISGDLHEFDDAVAGEKAAIDSWREIVNAAGDRYHYNLAFGARDRNLTGHWRDELAVLEKGLAAMQQQRAALKPGKLALLPVLKAPPGKDLFIRATADGSGGVPSIGIAAPDGKGYSGILPMAETTPGLWLGSIPGAQVREGLKYAVGLRPRNGAPGVPLSGAIAAEPLVSADETAPAIEHQPVTAARPGEPLRISAKVSDPSGIASARVRYRHLTQFENYSTLEMKPVAGGNFEATIPGEALSPDWDFIYYIEAVDKAGNGCIYPNLDREQPYVIVQLHKQ